MQTDQKAVQSHLLVSRKPTKAARNTSRKLLQRAMATANLPAISHPLSRLGNPEKINVRGISRGGERPSSQLHQELEKIDRLRPITADQIPWRLTKRNPAKETTLPALGAVPEGIEVKKADQAKPAIPIFGNRTDLASRADSRQSRSNTAGSYERSVINEFEELMREKMKTSYYVVKQAFKQYDPEGKGIITRESLVRILSSIVGRNISLSQFNRLMVRLRLDQKKIISIDEFYAAFRQPKKADQPPEWFQQQPRTTNYMTAAQVHAHLKEKAKQRFLNLGDLIPQLNPGGSGRVLKPELHNALNKLGFPIEDAEYDKLWQRYDTENVGVVKGERLLGKLGINLKDLTENSEKEPRESPEKSPRKLETERSQSLDVERWLKKKFREGCSEMRHAFQEIDLDRTGRVTKEEFKKVLKEYDLKLTTEKQIDDFLARCGVEFDGKIPYKEFLRRFQDRSEKGIPHKILANPLHRYHQSEIDSKFSTTSAIEAKILDMFQKYFLSLLGTLHKIDRNEQGLITQEQFRAAIESRFELGMTDEEYELFLNSVPIDGDGMVQYVEFMSRFDTKEQFSIFDRKSTIPERKYIPSDPESTAKSPRIHPMKSAETTDGRSVEEIKEMIRKIMNGNLQRVQEEFYDIDEFNSKRLTQEMFLRLMKRFGVDLSANEVKKLWNTLLTDQKRMLEFTQFVRHFGISSTTAQAYPNAKISPPKRGDSDFMMRSNKLNSAVDILYDQLRSKVDLNWERLQLEFKSLDPSNSGNINKGDFKDVILNLCVEMTDYEAEMLARKFQSKKDTNVSYVAFLEPFSRRRMVCHYGDNMQGVMSHRENEFPDAFGSKADKGLSSLTTKLKEKLSDDWMTLRRAFKKLDKKNDGYLDVNEFRSVLQLCNTVLEEHEVFELLDQLDDKMEGRVNYREFLKKISR